MRVVWLILSAGMLSRPILNWRSACPRHGAAKVWHPTFVVVVAVLFLAGIAISYFLGGQGTFQPGVDVSGRTVAAVPVHINALQDRDAAIRKKAATSLWLIGPEAIEATPALLVVLEDPDDGVRQAAARALGHCCPGTPAVIAGLVAVLKDKHAEVRAAAAGAFAEIWAAEKTSGDRTLVPKLQFGNEGSAERAAGPPDGTAEIRGLTEVLNDPDPRVRREAARALTEAGPLAATAAERLAHLAGGDVDRDVRLQAVLALGNTGPAAAEVAVPALVGVLRNDSRDGIRGNAGWALGRIHAQAETVIPALVEAFIREEMNDTRGMIAMGLAGYGSATRAAIPLLQAAATDPKVQENRDLVQSIRRIIQEIETRVPVRNE
jgi:HEAT repeat protein